jgi:predicted ArsR family transcriptional regulator
VRREAERHGVGRPRHVYDVTAAAQDLFPSSYDGYAAGLLAAVESVGGGELVEDVLAARGRRIAETINARFRSSLPAGSSLLERARELAQFQDESGYLAEAVLTADGTIRLEEHNCAIYRIAAANPSACRAELELFRQVLGADVVRETHIAAGDRCCSYRIADKRTV